ncbi:MAG: peptide transporter [Verrucomicrobiales bacterium]
MTKPKEKVERVDREVEEFRNMMQVPSTFEDGFNWLSLMGALFIAFVMIPGSIYMGLLAGEQNIGPAAQWVTVILFLEVARRAQRNLKKPEIFTLFFMAGAAMQLPFSGLIWHQYYMQSDAALAYGIAEHLPDWFAPPADSESYALRTFFHPDWLPVIFLVIFSTFFGQLSNLVLGYGLFRLTSDIEKLPFPMAPIGAQGMTALAEDVDETNAGTNERSWRWRVFSIGGAIGLFFGAIYLGLPTITGMITGTPIMIFPIPFVDLTDKTQGILPAVATGITWDLGNLIIGMVLPFFAMLGSFIGLLMTFVANPILYEFQILNSWLPGDNLVVTTFKNNIDFYFSFTIGVSLAIAIAGFWEVYVGMKKRARQARDKSMVINTSAPPGRGDIKPWIIIGCYFFVTAAYITVSGFLIGWHPGVMIALLFFGFVYTPLISYVTARLEGIAGQVVEIPMIREASLILSGYQGVKVWFLPLPVANYGIMTVQYRMAELTGTKFISLWKTKLVLYPIILGSSILFASFIWSLAEVPSSVYPFAQKMWELEAMNRSIIYSATLGEYSLFEDAFRWDYLGWGAGFGVLLFGVLNGVGAPIFLTYGVVRGLGQSLPQMIIPQMIGALIGKYYFQKKLGLKWRQYVPVVAAGFLCGTGLVTVASVGINFLSKAVIQLPF